MTERPKPPQRTREGRFLAGQAADAASAMVRTVQDAKKTIRTMIDAQSCVNRHPWIVVGAAVAVGFVTGVLSPGSSRKTNANTRTQAEVNGQQGCQGGETRTRRSAALASAGRFLASILQSLFQGLITTIFFSKERPRTETPLPNGSTETVVSEGRTD